MKLKSIIVLVIAMLLLAAFTTAFAAKPAEIKVWVRNQTGGELSLSLTDAAGVISFYDLPAGQSELTLVDGKYSYYASGLCGAQSGVWNLPDSATLTIDCKTSGLLISEDSHRCYNGIYIYSNPRYIPFPLFVPWQGWGTEMMKQLDDVSPWQNQTEMAEYYARAIPFYSEIKWGCYDGHTLIIR